MFKRYISVKEKIANFSDEAIVPIDTSKFPENVMYYIEDVDGKWWVEKDPFDGEEKDLDIQELALEIFSEIANRDDVKSATENFKIHYAEYDKYYLRKKIDNLVQEAQSLMTKLNEIEEETEE